MGLLTQQNVLTCSLTFVSILEGFGSSGLVGRAFAIALVQIQSQVSVVFLGLRVWTLHCLSLTPVGEMSAG